MDPNLFVAHGVTIPSDLADVRCNQKPDADKADKADGPALMHIEQACRRAGHPIGTDWLELPADPASSATRCEPYRDVTLA